MFYLPPEQADPIGLEDMRSFLRDMGPLDSDEKILDCVGPLRQLGANGPRLLRTIAKTFLDRNKQGGEFESVTNSFVLAREGGVAVRLNLWRPLRKGSKFDRFNGRIYAYGFPHDHDFDLLTVGAFGPGYTTSIYKYATTSTEIEVGTSVDSHPLGDFTLEEGAVLFYEQSRDIHIQNPSPSFSASLNLLAAQRVKVRCGQFAFDRDCRQIVGIPEYRGSRLLRLVEMLLEFADDESRELVRDLAKCYSDEFVARNLVRLVCTHTGLPPAEVAEDLGLPIATTDLMRGRVWSPNEMVVDV